jgi:pimeloyl-ACP methyl ester carboxylesterase
MDEAIRTRQVEANGLTFTVDAAGPGNGDATTAGPDGGDLVLLLHGYPQTRYTWRAELPALAAAGYRAWAPDQRGYSPGARPEGIDAYRTDHLVADVLALADAAGADRFHLVGHDWGGQIAWLTAAHRPERVRTLTVLSRPHPRAFVKAMAADPAQADRSRHHRAFQRPEATDAQLAEGGDRFRRLLGGHGVPAADVEAYLAVLGERPAMDAAINWYRAAGGAGLRAADTPAVTAPTLYIWGDEDASVGREAAEATARFVSGRYRFVELPGVGHFVTDQAPGVVPPLLLEHLAAAG